jgi:hypothetical protein
MRKVLFAWLIFSFSLVSRAQVDLNSELLMNSSGVSSGSGLESGRYKLKKSAGQNGPQEAPVVLKKRKPATKRSPMSEALFGGVTKVSSDQTEVKTEDQPVEAPAITDQVKSLVLGQAPEAVEAYKEQIHHDDVRLNLLEVTIATGVVSNSSKSNFSYRDYSTFSPQMLLGAEFWATPFVGIYGNYRSTMAADVSGGTVAGSRISAKHEWTELGFDVRKFFGLSRRSNSVQFGIHISEYKFSVPGDELKRVNLRGNGVGLHAKARIPIAPSYAWTFGGKLIPRVQQSETATGIDLSSGDKSESSRVDLGLGGEFKFSRQNQLTWEISGSYQKSVYGGAANRVDPLTGITPQGVSVENTFTFLTLGYRWGQ